MGMKENVNFARTTIKYTTSNSRIIPFGGLLIPGQMLDAIGFDRMVNESSKPTKNYKDSDILKAMLAGILCGNPDFESIHEMDDDQEFYCNAFHMRHMPSEATMRQRMDEIGGSKKETLRLANVQLFKRYGVEPSTPPVGFVCALLL